MKLCTHPTKVRAENISAVIAKGTLVGDDVAKKARLRPLRYQEVIFCGNRSCEHVFKAVPERHPQ